MKYKESIRKFCAALGLDQVGFLTCDFCHEMEPYFRYRESKGLINEFESKEIEKRVNIKSCMEDAKTIISIAFPYKYRVNCRNNNKFSFSTYTLGEDYHKVASKYLGLICDFIKEKLDGEAKFFVDSNNLPERYIAMRCGIGFLGKNNCLINEKYGSYVFLGEIVTNLIMDSDKSMESKCGQCRKCLDVCPTKAINGSENNKDNNANICLSYISQKKEVEDFWFPYFKNSLWGCDKCQEVCPYNKNAQYSNIREFCPKDYMMNLDLEHIISMNNEEFKKYYKSLACGWRGKNLLIRNAMICEKNIFGVIKNRENIASPYIKSYYDRLFNEKKL